MWLATKHGFFSVVEKEEGEFHIRARIKGDLENLRELTWRGHAMTLPEIETWPAADYRYRIIVGREDAEATLFLLIRHIDYSNFKSEIAATPDQRDKLGAYHDIWHTMHALQPRK